MNNSRIKRATLANIRQQLQAPAQALIGYSEMLLEQAAQIEADEVSEDIQRILSASENLSRTIDRLLGETGYEQINNAEDIGKTERTIRHDLRTPINGIKGYSEMLIEDLEDFGAESMHGDLEKLLNLADQLLGEISQIVQFSSVIDFGDKETGQMDSAMSVSLNLFDSIKELSRDDDSQSENKQTGYPILGHILVVDDIESNRDLLARRLIRDGHTVTCADGGEQALNMLQEDSFDLVLLDLMMPDINGYQVLLKMKADQELRNIPVIMISALEENDSVIRCIEAGANDYLQKPFNPTLLKARIKSGLDSKQWSDDERNQKRFIRQAFSHFISPTVVDQLLADPNRLRLGGERVEITCVFTDLTGFTSAVENSEPTEILPVLNKYLGALCKIVLEHQGTIDKIIGDALYAFFNAPIPHEDHAEAATRCAIAIGNFARQFKYEQDAQRFDFGDTRIGVHTGTAVVGNFGGESFFNYTAYGDTVNTTARLESVNRHLGTSICVSDATASRCPSIQFRPIGKLLLKGKTQSVVTHEPVSENRYQPNQISEYLRAYQQLETDIDKARASFSQLMITYPDDPMVQFHHRRIHKGLTGNTISFDKK